MSTDVNKALSDSRRLASLKFKSWAKCATCGLDLQVANTHVDNFCSQACLLRRGLAEKYKGLGKGNISETERQKIMQDPTVRTGPFHDVRNRGEN